jgi:hypothetical protein
MRTGGYGIVNETDARAGVKEGATIVTANNEVIIGGAASETAPVVNDG